MTEKSKAILTVALIIFLLSGSSLYYCIVQHNRSINSLIKMSEKDTHYILDAMKNSTFKTYRWRIQNLLNNNPKIIEAFATRNRKLLYELTLPQYEADCCANSFFDIMHFHLPDGTTFLRVHKPDFFGDNLKDVRPIINAVNRNHKILSGFEIGRHGAFYRVVQPIFYNNTYVGSLEFGINAYQIIDLLESETQLKSAAFFDERIWQKATYYKKIPVVKVGEYMLTSHNRSLSERLPKNFQFGKDKHPIVTIDKQTYVIHSHPIFNNFQGKSLGGLILFQDITQTVEQKSRFIFQVILLTSGLLVLAIIVLYYTFGRLIKSLRQSENKFRLMMESMNDPVYICSDDYHVEYMNPAMIKRTGRNATGEFCYNALHDFDQPCSWCKGKDEYKGKYFESDIVSPKDNHSFHISFSPIVNEDGSVSDMIVFRDMTIVKMLEAQLIQSQKMESIGTLAGGIAHDFNNILSAILGFSEMALLDLPDGSNAKKDIDQVITSGKRATDLVRQILTFSRKESLILKLLNPYPIVKEALKMQRSALPTTIKIEEDIDPECGEVRADPTQLHQVVMNLCTNAFQSMEDQMGVLKVKLWRTEIANKRIVGELGISAGQFIVLSVSDTGCGMDKTTKERIFEPYFTTKEVSKGTGLGLAVIHGIVESYSGFIKVESEPGRGTTFHVYIPALDKNIVTSLQETKKDGSLPAGTESIMVVDDEEAILDLHEKVLKRLGYKVTSTTDSLVALEKIRLDSNQFDLIVTDQSMPNLSGAGLAQEVLKIKPTMPIILCTGYSSVVSEKDAMAIGIKRYAKKPVELKELARIVRSVLDES